MAHPKHHGVSEKPVKEDDNLQVRDERLKREAEFFDVFYQGESDVFDPAILERYQTLSRRGLYSKEYRIAEAGNLANKRILDVGCGTGENAVLLAKLGADVTGIDVSPGAIAIAQRLAMSAGVQDRTEFLVEPFETFQPPKGLFDIVWIDAFLHHMIPVFDATMRSLSALVHPDGKMIIAEPIRISPLMRTLRGLFPDREDATPDERPLQQSEMDVINKYLVISRERYFHGIARLSPIFLGRSSYEDAAGWQRVGSDMTCRADQALLASRSVGRFLGGGIVLVGSPRRF